MRPATTVETNRAMLRVRDRLDRSYADAVPLADLAREAAMSSDHLIRTFRAVFGETPHRYLQRRRVERAMFLLRTTDRDVLDICTATGFISLGSFGRLFRAVVGETPTEHRARGPLPPVTGCFAMAWLRPADTAADASVPEKRDRAAPA